MRTTLHCTALHCARRDAALRCAEQEGEGGRGSGLSVAARLPGGKERERCAERGALQMVICKVWDFWWCWGHMGEERLGWGLCVIIRAAQVLRCNGVSFTMGNHLLHTRTRACLVLQNRKETLEIATKRR